MSLLKRPVVLLTFVREPAARCLSEFYHFHVSRNAEAPSESNKIAALRGATTL